MGKALALDTPIPTPSGWTTMGALQVGDMVFDERGQPCMVCFVTPVQEQRECFELSFDDGSAVVADAEHRWSAYDWAGWQALRMRHRRLADPHAVAELDHGTAGEEAPGLVTTRQMFETGRAARSGGGAVPNWFIPLCHPLELPEADLAADPYALGRRLGEAGCSRDAIPPVYLRASIKQRLALLQGLADTAGTIVDDTGVVELRLSDRQLLEQARELACSLGHRAEPVTSRLVRLASGRSMSAWRFSWSPLDQVFRAPRKAEALERSLARLTTGRMHRRAITSIRRVPSVPVRCIMVDSPSHLYLAGESMIPTHNTSFALGMASHGALVGQRPVLLFSLEMSQLEMSQRILCAEAKVDATRVRNGRLTEADWHKLTHAVGRLAPAQIFIDDNPMVSLMDIRAKARRLKSRVGDLGLVIIDYIQLMSTRSNAESRQVEVSEISRGLKILARELNTPVVALAQLNRQLEQRADKRPMLSDLRESGSLEQDADVVLFLYRDEVYNPETTDRGVAEVIVAKHRAGPTGKVQLAWLDHYTKFANMARNV
jgi:replicative DNA helicase